MKLYEMTSVYNSPNEFGPSTSVVKCVSYVCVEARAARAGRAAALLVLEVQQARAAPAGPAAARPAAPAAPDAPPLHHTHAHVRRTYHPYASSAAAATKLPPIDKHRSIGV